MSTKRTFRAGQLQMYLLRGFTAATIAMLFSTTVFAVSFDCSLKLSASERIVCSDPELATLDDRLAVAYRRAQTSAIDPRAIEADRTHQWLWRQQNCRERACVASWYQRRLAELHDRSKQSRTQHEKSSETALPALPRAADGARELRTSKKGRHEFSDPLPVRDFVVDTFA